MYKVTDSGFPMSLFSLAALKTLAPRSTSFASVIGFALVVGLVTMAPAALAAEPIGTVVDQRGDVTAVREPARVALARGAAILETDRIVTGVEATVKIALADGSVLTIGANSEVALESYLVGPDRGRIGAVLDLVLGIIRVTVSMSGDGAPFDVRTRAAVASARSTQWLVEATDRGTAVFVVEGEVAVSSRDANATVYLGPNFGVDVPPGGQPSSPKEWGAARVEDVLARTRLH